MKGRFALQHRQIKFDRIHDDKSLYEVFLHNKQLDTYLACSSKELKEYVLDQRYDLHEKFPITRRFPDMFCVHQQSFGLHQNMRGSVSYGRETGAAIYKKEHAVEGASFSRYRQKHSFAQNDVRRLVFRKEALLERQGAGLLFNGNGEIMTRSEFSERWDSKIEAYRDNMPAPQTRQQAANPAVALQVGHGTYLLFNFDSD